MNRAVPLFSSHAPDIGQRINHARLLLRTCQETLTQDRETALLLAELEVRTRLLHAQMAASSMPALCAVCGSGSRGGCCSPEMGNDCDSLLVLINLLLGCEVSVQRQDGVECFFLGPRGCILRCKPFFCLNYNCHKIKSGLSGEAMAELERRTGGLLWQQHLVEQRLRDFFRLPLLDPVEG